ncbi:unnamed protein product [Durusdinium trenchii]|uniref:Uncharacterized protein n=2 Tax=Durusdinium trenchii TaxID=1381693 RepID=A0ABP0QCM9_9DINO
MSSARSTTFMINLISGQEFEVQAFSNRVSDLKDAIEKFKAIPAYDQTLVCDGAELHNLAKVDPGSNLLLVIGNSFTNMAREFILNTSSGYGHVYRPLWGRPSSQMDAQALLQSCTVAAQRRQMEGCEVNQQLVYLSQEHMEDYLSRLETCDMALEAEARRNQIFTDRYDMDILNLTQGDTPMKALLDYRERCWDDSQVERARRSAQERDLVFVDPVEAEVLKNWENTCIDSSTWALWRWRHADEVPASGDELGAGWRELLRVSGGQPRPIRWPTLPAAPVLTLDLELGAILICGQSVEPQDSWRLLEGAGCSCWVVQSMLLQQMLEDGTWTAENWRRVFADFRLEIRTCSFLILEPSCQPMSWRTKICKSLMELRVEAVGCLLSLSMMASALQVPTAMYIDCSATSTTITPVFEGYMITDGIVRADSGDCREVLPSAVAQSLECCPIDTRRLLDRKGVLYGACSAKMLDHGSGESIEELKRKMKPMKLQIESRGTLYRGVCQVLHESYRRFILVTREQYEIEGIIALNHIHL